MKNNAQLKGVVKEIELLLQDELIGIYLHGSLAMGCFNLERSDIDLLIITKQAIPLHKKMNLATIMMSHSNQPSPLEVSALHLRQLKPWRYPTPYDFHYGESWRERYSQALESEKWDMFGEGVERLDRDLAAHIMITNTYGKCLSGTPIDDVFPIVPENDYVASIMYDFNDLRNVMDENPVYAVLNMCRVVLYLQEGTISSKKQGGEWALLHLPDRYRPLIEMALKRYEGRVNDFDCVGGNLHAFAQYMESLVERETERRTCH